METWKQSGLAAVMVVVAIVVAVGLQRWGLDQGVAVPAQPGLTASATSTPTANPSTGIADVDQLIAILTSGDVSEVKAKLIETPSPCVVNPQGIHNPPACPPGVAGGTMLPVFRASAGEAVWPDDLDRVLQHTVASDRTLYGVRRSLPSSPGQQQWVPWGDYMIVLGDAARTSSSVYFVNSQGVVGAIFVPWSSLSSVLSRIPSRADILPLQVALPGPAPSPTATPVPIGIDWSDRLAVYTGQVRVEKVGDRDVPVRAVITWDVTAGKLAAAFEYNGDGQQPVGVALSGHSVVFATESQVMQAGLDGSARRQVFGAANGEVIQDIAVSPDWRFVAVVVSRGGEPRSGTLYIVDLNKAQNVLVVQQSDNRLAAMRGYFWQVQWRSDHTGVLVNTATQSEAPGSLASIFLDGRVRSEDVQGYGNVSPTGTLRAGDIGESSGCMFIGTHNLVIRDLDTGATPVSIGGPGNAALLFTSWEWSPDGKQFVFVQQPTPTDCGQLTSTSGSVYVITAQSPGSFGAPVLVDDLSSLHRQWYGNNLFTADCDNGREPVVGLTGKLLPLCYSQPGPGPYQAVTVRVGGQAIGTAVDPVPVGVIAP